MITYILQHEIPFKVIFSKSRSRHTFLGFDPIDIILSNMYLQLVYEKSMSSNKAFSCHDLLIGLTKCIKFMTTYILQYEIPLQIKFINLGHDPLFWVMT